MTESTCMLNFGSETLDEILRFNKTARDMKGIGFAYSFVNAKYKFVPPVKNLRSLCQTICHNILFDIVTNTLIPTTELHECVSIMANKAM